LRKDWEELRNISGQTGHVSKVEEDIPREISRALCGCTDCESQVEINKDLSATVTANGYSPHEFVFSIPYNWGSVSWHCSLCGSCRHRLAVSISADAAKPFCCGCRRRATSGEVIRLPIIRGGWEMNFSG
jgi:hypothetical protein